MVTDQLLGCFDDLPASNSGSGEHGGQEKVQGSTEGGSGCGDGGSGGCGGSPDSSSGPSAGAQEGTPAQICALLAHLLLLAAGGGVGQATALCDTFGESVSCSFPAQSCLGD